MASHGINRLLFGVCLACCWCLLNACATTRGAGAERAETIAAKVETVKDIIRTSNLSDDQKRAAETVLDSIAVDSRQLGKDVDENKKIADSNASAAHKWHVLEWSLGIVGILSLILLWIFRGSIISKLFSKVQS